MENVPQEKEDIIKSYWEKNITAFSGFYDKGSEEKFEAPWPLGWIYRNVLFPVEKKYMWHRYNMVKKYLKSQLNPGVKLADIGCGSGIFTQMAIEAGGFVYAIDYSKNAIALVKNTLPQEFQKFVEYKNIDIRNTPVPDVDVAIAIGVLTYIDGIELFFNNILPYTKDILVNFMNRLRQFFPILNVRNLSFHTIDMIEAAFEQHNFVVEDIQSLATGFMVRGTKKNER